MWLYLSVAVLVVVFIAIFSLLQRKKRQPAYHNRRVKRAKRSAPVVENTVHEVSSEDSDEILGLKKKVVESEVSIEGRSEVASVAREAPKEKAGPYELVVLHLLSPDERPYRGYELLQALLSSGLRFGEHKVFHRHAQKNGTGQTWFSMTSINKPGTFDMPSMGSYSCPGLSFFLPLDPEVDVSEAFDSMLETVKQLQTDLGGDLLDASRQRLTMEKVAQLQQRVYQFEASQRIPDMFAELEP